MFDKERAANSRPYPSVRRAHGEELAALEWVSAAVVASQVGGSARRRQLNHAQLLLLLAVMGRSRGSRATHLRVRQRHRRLGVGNVVDGHRVRVLGPPCNR